MKIRPFEQGDRTAVISLWERSNLIVPWNDPATDIDRKLQVQAELFLVGIEGENLVSTAMGGYDGHRGWIYYLAVEPACRGRGYGSQLVEHLSEIMLEKGCPKVNIMVRSSNREVVRFYRQLGFKQDEVVCMGRRLVEE